MRPEEKAIFEALCRRILEEKDPSTLAQLAAQLDEMLKLMQSGPKPKPQRQVRIQ